MNHIQCGCVIGLLILFSGTANASPFYVAKTGSNNNSCADAQNQATPKLTIAGGIGCLSSGETLIVKAGTYSETDLGNAIPNGTSNNYTIIKADAGDAVVIVPSGANSRAFYFSPGKAYIEIDGIDCDGRSAVMHCMKVWGSAHHIRVKNVDWGWVRGTVVMYADGPISTYPEGVGNHEFLDSNIHHGGRDCSAGNLPTDYGFYISHDNVKIWRNNIHDNMGYGVQIYDGAQNAHVSNVDIRYNRIFSNGDVLCGSGKGAGIGDYGTNTLVVNNLIYDNNSGGIDASPTNGKYYNNTITGSRGSAPWAGGIYQFNNSSITLRNNIIYETKVKPIENNGNSMTESNNITGNPSFVDAASNDYYIRSGSSAIDTGRTLAEVTDDFNNVSRPQGGAVDVGAFEYTGGGPPAVTATPTPPSNFAAN